MSDLTGSEIEPEDAKLAWSLWGAKMDNSMQETLEALDPALFAPRDSRGPRPRRRDYDIASIRLDRAILRSQLAIDRVREQDEQQPQKQ